MMFAKEYELFENLINLNYNGRDYDLHNDYNCIFIQFDKNTLILKFEHIKNKNIIDLCFEKATIITIELGYKEEMRELTIDNIYRGRYEINNQLFEFSDDGKSYFYIEFCEDIRMELFVETIAIKGF